MPPKPKHLSGSQKRKKRKLEEESRKAQIKKNAKIHTFFQKQPQSSDVNEKDVHVDEDVHIDEDDHGNVDGHEATHDHVNGNTNVDEDVVDASVDEDDVDGNLYNDDVNVTPKIDIFDPRNWDGLNPNLINVLVKKGPKRDLSIIKGPMDKYGRRFTSNLYTRTLSNKETCDRTWLVYSKVVNKLFCFCCKLFRQGPPKGSLDGDGYEDWKHVGDRLKDHERGFEHMKNMQRLFEMRQRLNLLNMQRLFERGFEFIVSIVIWYEILNMMNVVSKKLQSKDMIIDVAIDQVKKLVTFFKEFREVGLSNAINEAEKIAIELDVDPVFKQRRHIRRKKQFDETSNAQEVLFSPEEDFKVNYFLCIVDQAISSLEKRFEQYQEYEKLFGFLFPKKLRELGENDLRSCCYCLQDALKNGEESDIDAEELYAELKLFETFLPKNIISPLDALNNLKQVDSYPNALVAYRVLLTIPVTVASAERSFSKLKLLKTYLRSSMSQERLNGLAIIAIENDELETLDYKELIESFASKNARRASRFV